MLAKLSTGSNLEGSQSSDGLKAHGQDPAADVTGLTSKILEEGITEKGVVDLEHVSVLVQVTEYREPEVPPYADVKNKLIQTWKEREARNQSKRTADELLAKIVEDQSVSLEAAAKGRKLVAKTEKDLTPEKPGKGVLASQAIRKAIFSARKQGFVPNTVFNTDTGFMVVQVTGINTPQVETDPKALNSARQKASGRLGQIVTEQILNSLKSETKIDVDPGLLTES